MNMERKEQSSTAKMIEESFFKNLEKTTLGKKSNVSNIIKNITDTKTNYNTEEILMDLYEARDNLIESCRNFDIDSESTKSITCSINKLGNCIKKIGGKVEDFDPINYVMGLQMPNLKKNAEKVIETTKQYYALGSIENADISDNGKTINMTFSGQKNDKEYKAIGTITASSWTGNEAIDYVYKVGSGKMFVRAFNNGKWEDKSNDYEILWELQENPISKEGNNINNNEIDNTNKIEDQNEENFPINDESK